MSIQGLCMEWGLLGPGKIESNRRTRSLGVGASVRKFNDLAVPGISGISFCKQLFLAAVGIEVAETARLEGARVSNIQVTNAIEALACWLDFQFGNLRVDRRLRGSTKLPARTKQDLAFKHLRQPRSYVTQPMRMGTTTALPALGLAEADGSRFNGFRLADSGRELVATTCQGLRPNHSTVVRCLVNWVKGGMPPVHSRQMYEALAPTLPLPRPSLQIVERCLLNGGPREPDMDTARRRNAYRWVSQIKPPHHGVPMDLDGSKPAVLTDEHWMDLRAGARFFATRDAAIALLDAVEWHLSTLGTGAWDPAASMPDQVGEALAYLKMQAGAYVEIGHPDQDAQTFCKECIVQDPVSVIRSLVERDGQVLRLAGVTVKPGPAFQPRVPGDDSLVEEDAESSSDSFGDVWPEHISYRIPNLYLLHTDIIGGPNAGLTE